MNKLKELGKKKWFLIAVIIITIALVGSLGTYAMFIWNSTDNTNVTLKIGDVAEVFFPNGQELNTNNLTPVFNYTDGETLTFSIKNKDTTGANIKYTVNFNITNIDEELANSSLKYKLVSGNNVIGEGDFSTATNNSTMKLANGMLSSGTTNFTFYLYIDSNIENNPNMMNKNIRGVMEVTAEELHPFNLAQHITNLYTTNKDAKPVTNNEINYQYASSVNLMNDRLGGTTTSLDGGNIRYYGADPNNYIDIGDKTEVEVTQGNWEVLPGAPFSDRVGCLEWMQNNEQYAPRILSETGYSSADELCTVSPTPAGQPILWRIIGVFDGKLRVRRDENIGAYSFDTSASDINDGNGINEWSQADLMKLLNPEYETNQDYDTDGETLIPVNNSLYWNSESGKCYNGSSYTNTNCDFTNSGLSDEAKEYVVDQTLYLGGFDTNSVFANQAYELERGSNVIQNPDDGIARTTRWTGKVGLIYPSDFGYAADFSNAKCQRDLSTFYNSKIGKINCTANWMAQGRSWTVSPRAADASDELYVRNGNFNDSFSHNDIGGWPTLLLNSSVMALGTGSKDDPFVIG